MQKYLKKVLQSDMYIYFLCCQFLVSKLSLRHIHKYFQNLYLYQLLLDTLNIC